MIQDYLEFNVARFVRDCYEHKTQIQVLIGELKEIDGVRAIDPTKEKISGTPNNNGVVNLVMLRARLKDRIKDYEHDLKLLQDAMKTLTDDEKEAIEICFNGRPIERQCEEYHIEKRTLYNHRKKALAKISKSIIG